MRCGVQTTPHPTPPRVWALDVPRCDKPYTNPNHVANGTCGALSLLLLLQYPIEQERRE
jgi:hypothetical protein